MPKSTLIHTDVSQNQNVVIQIRSGHFLHQSTTATAFYTNFYW